MNFFLTGTGTGMAGYSGIIPPGGMQYILQAAETLFLNTSGGWLLLQELAGAHHCVRIDIAEATEELDIDFYASQKTCSLLFVLEGSCSFKSHDDERLYLREGSYYLCYLSQQCQHVVSYPSGRSRTLQVDVTNVLPEHSADYTPLKEVEDSMGDNTFTGVFCTCQGTIDFRMQQLIDCFLKSSGTDWEMELGVQSLASGLVRLYVGELENNRSRGRKLPAVMRKLEKVREYINGNLENPVRMHQLAKIFGSSLSGLNKQYKLYYGESLRDYIHRQKMEFALLLLKDIKITVNEVAEMTGYNNANNFTRAFTLYFGCTPSIARSRNISACNGNGEK